MSLEALELAVRTEPRLTAIVVMPHSQMPQGAVMPDSQKARLVAFSRNNDLALIEDDSYRLLLDSSMRPRPAKAWDESGHVIYCESFNKTLAPGIRQGWMSAGRWHERVSMLKFAQSRSTAQWAQLLAARWSASPAYARHLTRLRTALRSQREQSARAQPTRPVDLLHIGGRQRILIYDQVVAHANGGDRVHVAWRPGKGEQVVNNLRFISSRLRQHLLHLHRCRFRSATLLCAFKAWATGAKVAQRPMQTCRIERWYREIQTTNARLALKDVEQNHIHHHAVAEGSRPQRAIMVRSRWPCRDGGSG